MMFQTTLEALGVMLLLTRSPLAQTKVLSEQRKSGSEGYCGRTGLGARGRGQHHRVLASCSRCQIARQSSLLTRGWQEVCLGAGPVSVAAGVSALGLGEEHVSGYLSPSILRLFLLGGDRVEVVAGDKQGLIGEFCADPGQELLRAGQGSLGTQRWCSLGWLVAL